MTSEPDKLRVGAYVDAFNLYYGGIDHCGRGTPGWRWLNIFGLLNSLVDPALWRGAHLHHVVYCTAPRDRAGDPTSIIDQRTYIAALEGVAPCRFTLEMGHYASRTKTGHLTYLRQRRRLPSPGRAALPSWLPVKEVKDPEGNAVLQATVVTFEEKGSDVNVATRLTADVLGGDVDAAIVISNDSDLALPIKLARDRVPVGTINPGKAYTAKELRGRADVGAGRHWWRRLNSQDFETHQLPKPAGPHACPSGW